MANKIQVRRGLRAHLPVLSIGELGFCTDTKELFIGSENGNIAIANLEHEHEFTHDHDERYYTKSATNNLLNEKADINHNHTKSDITDFAHTHSEYLTDLPEHSHDEYLTSLPTHDHDERYNTKAEITTLLGGKANNTHSHAISDITNLQTSLNGKANINHTHISVGTSNGGADIWYKVIG